MADPVVAMGPSMVATGLSAVTIVLLGVLTAIWLANYRRFRSPVILGLVVFGVVLLVENVVAVYFALTGMAMLYAADPFVGDVVLAMRILELVAVASLTYVTLE